MIKKTANILLEQEPRWKEQRGFHLCEGVPSGVGLRSLSRAERLGERAWLLREELLLPLLLQALQLSRLRMRVLSRAYSSSRSGTSGLIVLQNRIIKFP